MLAAGRDGTEQRLPAPALPSALPAHPGAPQAKGMSGMLTAMLHLPRLTPLTELICSTPRHHNSNFISR